MGIAESTGLLIILRLKLSCRFKTRFLNYGDERVLLRFDSESERIKIKTQKNRKKTGIKKIKESKV